MQRGELEAKGLTPPSSLIRHARALPPPASCAGSGGSILHSGTKKP